MIGRFAPLFCYKRCDLLPEALPAEALRIAAQDLRAEAALPLQKLVHRWGWRLCQKNRAFYTPEVAVTQPAGEILEHPSST